MTNLRKCHGFSLFAVIALAFVCLVVSQATIAKVEKTTINGNADNSFETDVPLPTLHRGSSLSIGEAVIGSQADEDPLGDETLQMDLRKVGKSTPPVADGTTKAAGDDYTDPFVIGDETALPFTGAGDVSTGTNAGDVGLCVYGVDLCANGYSCAPDQWWAFTPTADMRVDVTLANGTYDGDDDWAMMITDGDDVSAIICADPAAGVMPSFVNVQLTGGHTYYIMVEATWGIGASGGAYQIDVTEYVPHPDFCTPMCAMATQSETEVCGDRTNGGCYGNYPDETQDQATAEVVTGDPLAAILCGTLDLNPYIDPSSTTIRSGIERDADQWKFTLTDITKLTVELGAEIQCRLFMHGHPTTSCGDQVSYGVIDANQGDIVSGVYILQPGDYCFSIRANAQIMGCGEGDYGDPRYYIKTGFIPLVPFDDCPLATEISGDTDGTPIVQDMCGLQGDGTVSNEYGAYYAEQNGWFLWTCEESGEYTFSTCTTPDIAVGESYDLFMSVWDYNNYDCASANYTNQLVGDDDGCYGTTGGYQTQVTFIAAEGLQYLITIGAWTWNSTCGDLWLEISHDPIPLYGDNCLGTGDEAPIELTSDQFGTFFNNLNATPDGPDPSYCNEGSFGGDIWFRVTAWETGYAYADFCNCNFDANMEVYAGGDCVNNTDYRDPIRCNDDGCKDDTYDWPVWHGSITSWNAVAGEQYLVRVGGWYDPPDHPLADGGMGFGWYDLFIVADPTTVAPANDNCVDVSPIMLADAVSNEVTGNTFYATRNDCEDFPPNHEPEVWEAFTIPTGVCMDVTLDFFGTVDPYQGNGVRYGADPGEVFAWTGCPCEGEFVGVPTTIGCLQGNECAVTGGDFNNFHAWEMMPAGDYWATINHTAVGTMGYEFDYVAHIIGYEITCEYCVATANIGACPPVAGASWVDAVRLAEINNSGTGCNAYEDRTSETASLYKGITYTLEFDMGKQGTPSYTYDLAYVWIDWNQNSVFFDNGEEYEPTRLAYTWTIDVTPPLDAVDPGMGASGECRMRIRLGSTGNTGNTYCGAVTFGEVEDYVILATDIECGDFDIDGDIDADDIAFLQAWYFGGGTAPDYWQRADIDGDGMITLADLIALVDAAYFGGATVCM